MEDHTVELLSHIIQYVVHEKIDNVVKIMLEHNGTVLSRQVLQMINDESKKEMEQIVANLI